MRKRIKTMKTAIAALMLCGTALTPALAQNCTSPTRCDELGYKKSASDCDGMESLTCPFDSSKYFCHDKDDCDKLGYTKSAEACNGLESLVCPSDNSKYFCVLKEKPGLIYYSDGSFSHDLEDGKTPVGIIAVVNNNSYFIISLEETQTTWGPEGYNVPCLTDYLGNGYNPSDLPTNPADDFEGEAGTKCILSESATYPAAEWCNSFSASDSGIGSSGWYLPAAGELYAISENISAINSTLNKLGRPEIPHKYHWSTTETSNARTWKCNPTTGSLGSEARSNILNVRCLLAL